MIPELAKFRDTLGSKFIIDDWEAVDIIVAVAVAHKFKGEMLWLRVIGASGSGKTEILRTFIAQKGYTETLETLTPSAIRRGFKPVRRNPKTDELEPMISSQTLLQRMDGKLVITKELAPLLTRQHESRLEVFGLLRSLHDGELDADYGSFEGHIKQKCCFDWIIGTTGQVESENQLEMQLGSRFTDLHWGTPNSVTSAIDQAVDNLGGIDSIREELGNCMSSIVARTNLEASKEKFYKQWYPANKKKFLELCKILAILRTPVKRDNHDRGVLEDPLPEVGTRIGQSYAKVSIGLMMLGIEDIMPYLVRLTWDGLPRNRRVVLRAIDKVEQEERIPRPSDDITNVSQWAISQYSKEIEHDDGTGLSQPTVFYILQDMRILKVKDLPWRQLLCR